VPDSFFGEGHLCCKESLAFHGINQRRSLNTDRTDSTLRSTRISAEEELNGFTAGDCAFD